MINAIVGRQVFIINGGMKMEHRNIGKITGNSFGANANFQGDNATLTNIEQTTDLQSYLTELKQEIQTIPDTEILEDASMHYDMLIKYLEENKPTRVAKCLTALKGIVGSAASILAIASKLGITL